MTNSVYSLGSVQYLMKTTTPSLALKAMLRGVVPVQMWVLGCLRYLYKVLCDH